MNVIVSFVTSIPPDSVFSLASNGNSLYLFERIGSKTAPLPFPPVTVIEIIFSISKSCGST